MGVPLVQNLLKAGFNVSVVDANPQTVAVFLASRASDYITGQTIFVDGGFSAG